MGWRCRHRRGRRGRLPKPITLEKPPTLTHFTPTPPTDAEPILIEPAEIEALRLVDLIGLSQEEAGSQMGVSRGTIWRLTQSARRKVALALSEGRGLVVAGGGLGECVDG
ncbi:MAG: DUF134 domain-containing protein [Candidatus Bathyarchaeota archaeon]|nr:DUF134 domain-containing protein [Candidatus Bathyarchaeota archaeon]